MWCAIIVNKQMKNHHHSVQPENLKIPRRRKRNKLFKNFHRNFNFFSRFEAFLGDFPSHHRRKISLQPRIADERSFIMRSWCMRRKFRSANILMTTTAILMISDNAENKDTREAFPKKNSRNCNSRVRKI